MSAISITLFIMLVTFIIGFVVAGLIALIVPINDMTTYYRTHSKAYERLRKIEKIRRKQIENHLFDITDQPGNELLAHYYASHLPQTKFANDTNEIIEHYYYARNNKKDK